MSKKIAKVVKIQLPAGEAKPGAALASAGIVMPKFCSEFNEKTADKKGNIIPVIITAYEDKSFDFVIKTSPVANEIKKALITKHNIAPHRIEIEALGSENPVGDNTTREGRIENNRVEMIIQ